MKRLSVILMACLLVLGMSQCKKEKPNETNEEGVSISLKVIGDNAGSKANVDPGESTAPVTYEDGDVIYVVSEGKYVGTLTRDDATFRGEVTGAVVDKTLSFFFLGNKSVGTLTAGVSTSCTVDISDQTKGLPVISYGVSDETFEGVTASYTCRLNNQCALVKFNLRSELDLAVNTNATITITGGVTNLTNELTVNFNGGNDVVTSLGTGNIATYGQGSTRYAVVAMKQADIINGVVNADGYEGTYSISGIGRNVYVTCSMTLHAPHAYVDLGLPSGLLWATCNVGADSPERYGDYYQWGGVTPVTSTSINVGWANCPGNGGNSSYNAAAFNTWKSSNLTNNVLKPEVDAASVNWGGDWRMPTTGDWEELKDYTTCTWTTENGVNGRKFTSKTDSSKSIFLPAAGYRSGTSVYNAGSFGDYWSSSLDSSNPNYAYYMNFSSRNVNPQNYDGRYLGFSVRPVRKK